jgi:hypothetical protein
MPGDDPGQYDTVAHGGYDWLKKGDDGNCIYLGETGCQIHGRAPRACQAFDCRRYALLRQELEQLPPQSQGSVLEGRRRLRELNLWEG